MTQIDDDIKYGMIDAISHLIHRDYEAIVEDFVTLQFIPKGTNLSPILPVLANVFDQALEGGGAKNINFQELAADLGQITFDYPFRIPPCAPHAVAPDTVCLKLVCRCWLMSGRMHKWCRAQKGRCAVLDQMLFFAKPTLSFFAVHAGTLRSSFALSRCWKASRW